MMELDENYKKRMKELMEEFNEQGRRKKTKS